MEVYLKESPGKDALVLDLPTVSEHSLLWFKMVNNKL